MRGYRCGRRCGLKLKLASLGLALALIVALFGLCPQALEVSQLEFDLEVPPGGTATYSFVVGNNEEIVDDIRIYLIDWDRDLEGNHRFYEPGTLPRSNTAWITVSPSHFSLQPGERREVRFTIKVPADAEGTYWGMIMVEGRPRPQEGEEGMVMAVPRFGIKVYETPRGTAHRDGRITHMERLGLNPLTVLVEFENTGNAHLRVDGWVEIRDTWGETVRSLKIGRFPLLPGAKRRVRAIDTDGDGEPLPPGDYLALAVLDFGGPYLIAGQIPFKVEELHLRPIGEATAPPQDLDGDGLYEDINGDGQLTMDDVALLEANINSPEVQENARAFDFDNDGDADLDDVQVLKEMVEAQGG